MQVSIMRWEKWEQKLAKVTKQKLKVLDYETGITIFKKTKLKNLPNTRKPQWGSTEHPTSSVQW